MGGKETSGRYSHEMSEDPRYLRNQSRAVHRTFRRNKGILRWIMVLWLLAVLAFTSTAIFDVVGDLGWGYETKDVWAGLLMVVLGGAFWAFATLISHVFLGISRRLYGPEPDGPMEG